MADLQSTVSLDVSAALRSIQQLGGEIDKLLAKLTTTSFTLNGEVDVDVSDAETALDGIEDIIVDVLLCFSSVVEIESWKMEDTMWKDAFSYYNRRNEVSSFYSNYEDMLRVTRGYPNVHFRYTVAPTE